MRIQKIFETAKDTDRRISSVPVNGRIWTANGGESCRITLGKTADGRKFNGFGGAVTESAGYIMSWLSPEKRAEIIDAYYGTAAGNGYVYARTHLNSSDFSLENWACVPQKDESLGTFSMERTDKYLTPVLLDVQEKAGRENFRLMVTPWSPPAWMKDNNDMNNGGKLKPEYRQLWADYITKFLTELKKRGLDTDIISIQNEPAAVQRWDSCIWSAEEEGIFAAEYLGPTFGKAGFGKTGILVWDHNRDLLEERFSASMSLPGAEKYIAGAAYHWYSGDQYGNVRKCAEKFPEKQLVFSEGCIEGGARPGAWYSGERYAHNIINDLNSGCTAWIDWNLVLDMNGGPNHAGNYCDAPVLADVTKNEIHFQSSYYYIGHFSRFIRPGAVRIGLEMDAFMTPATPDGKMGNMMEACAFRNKDGSTAVVISNRTEADMVYILDTGTEKKTFFCPPRAIQTLTAGE